MVNYINDHLISDEIQSEGTWNRGPQPEDYKRCLIKTHGAVKKQEDGSFAKFDRIICVHNIGSSPAAKTRIASTIMDGDRQGRVTIRTSADTRFETDVFVIAIPYDGMILPASVDPSLMIYRSMIMKSDKISFEHEDRKYKRCLYLVVSPQYGALQNSGWYDEKTNLVIETVQSNKGRNTDPDDENSVWRVTKHTIRFGADGLYEYTVDFDEVPYSTIDPDALHKAKIVPIVSPTHINKREGASTNNVGEAMKKAFTEKRQKKNKGPKQG